MSIFTDVLGFLHGIFNRVRPGLESFLKEYQNEILSVVKSTATKFAGLPLQQWRDEAFKDVQAASTTFANSPGTWITIAINIAYDIIKAGNA